VSLLRPHDFPAGAAKRSLGQNFLVDPLAQRRIVDALDASSEDCVVELGPGRGALTRHLLGKVGHLRLIELDRALVGSWQRRVGDRDDTSIVAGDMLKVPLHEAFPQPESALVLGNIPYNITSPVIFRLLQVPRPNRIVLTVQKEVALRLVARPGTSQYGALSVGVQSVSEVELLFSLSARAFRPRPRVDSAVVRIVPITPSPLTPAEERSVRGVVRACFEWRRKQMGRTVRSHPRLGFGKERAALLLDHVAIAHDRRPGTLSPQEFHRLARAVSSLRRGGPLPTAYPEIDCTGAG